MLAKKSTNVNLSQLRCFWGFYVLLMRWLRAPSNILHVSIASNYWSGASAAHFHTVTTAKTG